MAKKRTFKSAQKSKSCFTQRSTQKSIPQKSTQKSITKKNGQILKSIFNFPIQSRFGECAFSNYIFILPTIWGNCKMGQL